MLLAEICMRKEVLVFVNIIAPYNIPLFNRISQSLNNVLFLFDQVKEANRSWNIQDENIHFDYFIEDSFHLKRSSKVANGTSLQRTIYFPFFVFKKIWLYKPTTVLSIEFGLRTMFSMIMCKLTGAKLYVISDVTCVTEANVGYAKKLIRKLIARNLDGAVARSYNAKKYLESLGVSKRKIIVSPYAIETSNYANQPKCAGEQWSPSLSLKEKIKNKFCILYCGQLIHRKGIDLLINVVNDLPKDIQDKLVILLAGGNETDLTNLSINYHKDIFIPLGFIPNEQMLSIYPLADCFILPTRSDTWALVVNEAVVAGCPVMVSKYAGSANELIEDEYSGIVFDPLDEKEFLYKLIFCVQNKQLLTMFAANAKKKLAEYNNDVAAQRIVDLIKQSTNNL